MKPEPVTSDYYEIKISEYEKLLADSRMLKALIAAGARGTHVWVKASQLLRTDFGQ